MFILASASPRRRELLQQIGANFSVEESHAAEIMAGEPREIVRENAIAKAKEVYNRFKNFAVLGADTIVVTDNKILGKPKTSERAKIMLTELAGRSHEVLTGIAWIKDGKVFSDVVATIVNFLPLTAEEIDDYVNTGEPLDKAGAYAVQGRAARFIDTLNGSYSNVVGLPLAATNKLAKKAGVDMYGNNGTGLAP